MATIPLASWLEATGDRGPTDAALTMKTGRHTLQYQINNAGIDGLQQAITQILGTVRASTSSPKLTRTLPVASPIFPYFYASAISGIRGVGAPAKTATSTLAKTVAASPFTLPQPMPNIAMYPVWELSVEFTPRPYAAMTDDQIAGSSKIVTTWTPPPSTAGEVIANIDSIFCQEYIRFTDFDIVPQNDSITGTQGTFTFRTKTPGATIEGKSFQGMVRMLLPNQILRLRWHEVPLNYYMSANSYLKRFVGYINQFDWFPWGGDVVFPAGSLLYIGTNPVQYTSPVIQLQQWARGDLSTSKLATMEMTFLVTSRIGGASEGGQMTPANANFIAAGHNLLPFFPNREYHYSVFNSSAIDRTLQAPAWYSIPFDMLFTNPDFSQTPPIPPAY